MRKLLLLLPYIIVTACTEAGRFELIPSEHSGIEFNNRITETESLNLLNYQYIYNGAGVGLADVNNDGLQDIIFTGNQVSSKVYLNQGDFRFRDITSSFEGLTDNQWYSGVAVADVNCDKLPDIYLTSTGNKDPDKCKNRLWINMGSGNDGIPAFREMAEEYGIADKGPSVAAAFFDSDLDGDLDLYILNSSETQRMNTSYLKKITDGSAANNDRLYRNNGNGTFTDVTIPAGIVYEGYGLGLAIGDVNKDGYPDIYVSNDYISNDLLYINRGDGTFVNEIGRYLSYQTRSSMGNDMADVNNDGNPDILTLDMLPESYAKRKQTINGFSYIFYLNDEKFGYEHQYIRNMLHLHNGFINGQLIPFSEVGQMMGISQTDWSWSGQFADFDNDGDKDLFVTNGYPRDLTDKDWLWFMAKNKGLSQLEIIAMMPEVKINNILFENIGGEGFAKRNEWLPHNPSYSYGAAYADLDNDGDLDYVVNNLNDKAFILKNNTREKSANKSNFLRIRLKGSGYNTMGIGAKVELWSKSGYQFTENFLTKGYASSVEPVISFGISGDTEIDSVKVTWPLKGNKSLVVKPAVNKVIEIDESNSVSSVSNLNNEVPTRYLFNRKEGIFEYAHVQKDFVDFFLNQKTIPHKFSQIGPVIIKGDIDGDGNADLLAGATNTLPTMLFLRRGDRFENSELKGLTANREFTESDLAITDIDNDGDNDVIAVAGGFEYLKESEQQENLYMATAAGYEGSNEKKYTHYLYENQTDSFKRILLPIPPFLASVVRVCDFNHDGNNEIFVGSRVKKGTFPFSNPSWLIFNDKGKLSVGTSSSLDIGMVTDALWTDFDKDGWEDLFVVREWDAPLILRNNLGRELIPLKTKEFDNLHGIWYSMTAGDLDLDGDDDYVLGNLGENSQFKVTEQYPLSLYVLDFDMDGIIDPFMTGFWKDEKGRMTEYPVNYLDELMEQSSYFQMRFKDYTSFSKCPVTDILSEKMRTRIRGILYANNLSSGILWNDEGKFRWERLPQQVQVAPVKEIIIKDFNNDSRPDIIAAGNDYSWEISTGYLDALKGVVLLGKKDGRGFNLILPSESGLVFQGMVQSLLFFDGDPAYLVAGINRGRALVFEQRNY